MSVITVQYKAFTHARGDDSSGCIERAMGKPPKSRQLSFRQGEWRGVEGNSQAHWGCL